MNPAPETKAASAPARTPANHPKQCGKSSISNGTGKPKFATRQSAAEDSARQLIYSWVENGRHSASDLPPDRFPNETLGKIAEAVAWATGEGIRGVADISTECFLDAPEGIHAEFMTCCDGVFPASPEHCRPLVEKLEAFHVEKRQREILDAAHHANESGKDIKGHVAELVKLEADGTSVGIASLLAERAFNFSLKPEKPIPIFRLCDLPLSTAGNLTNIQALPKAGKSAVIESQIAAVMNGNRQGPDTLGFSAENPHGHALIHFDTEQSRFDHDSLIRRAVHRAGVTEPPPWFHSYCVADLSVSDRRAALRHAMAEGHRNHGGVFAVLIDGVADFCADPNDSAEAFDLVHELHTLAILHACTINTVLHENPGSEIGKTRGHLGSQLERKAETNLRLAKDKDGITTLWAERARHLHLPKEQGSCFSWNDTEQRHTSCGTAGEIKSTADRERMETDAEAAFNGQESFRHDELVESIGEAFTVKERAAKGRLQKWTAKGIVRKDSSGNYRLSKP